MNFPGTNAATNARPAKDASAGRLGMRLALGVILVSALVTGVFTVIELYRQYRIEVDEITRQFISINRSMVPALAEAVWVEDPVQIRIILDGLVNLRDVESATVMAEGAKSWSAGARVSKRTLAHAIPLHRSYKGSEVAIGRLEIVASVDNVYDRLWNMLLVTLASNAMKTALVVLFMVYLFRRLVGRHLRYIACHVVGLGSDRAAALELEREPADGPWRPDILDEVVAAVNQANGALSAQRVQLKSQVAALRESEERFRATFDQAAVGIAHVSPEGRWMRVNQKLCDIVGYSREELLTKTFQDLTHPDDLDADLGYVRQMLAGEIKIYSLEKRYFRKDSSLVWINLTVALVRGETGQPKYFISVIEDITERKRAEEALRESEDKFKHVFESANVGKSITLPAGEIFVNKAFADMLGYSQDELESKTWQELTPPDEVESNQAQLTPLLKGEKDSARLTKRYIHKKGSCVWADVSVAIRRGADGKPRHFITTIVDITERKLAEDKLHVSEERFSNAFHIGPAGMTITRVADGKFIDANDSFLGMFEFNRDEVVGHTSTELNMWTPDERRKLIQQQLESGGLRDYELVARSKSGKLINLLFSSKPIELEGETCHITTMIDITERKRAEKSLKRYAERLLNLHRIDAAILQVIETPEAIARAALLSLRVLLDCQRASIGIFDPGTKTVRVLAAEIKGATCVQAGKDLTESAYGDVESLRQGTVEIVEDMSRVTSLSPMAQLLQGEGVAASINVPLISQRGLVGALNIGWEEPRAVTPEEKETAAEVAAQIAIALEQARLLEETRRHAAELEQRVAERTAQFEAANKELEAFSYSVSHDLRAPLRAIDGYTGILIEDYGTHLDAEGQRVCTVISESARTMGKLIDDLLSLSRVGRAALQPALVDMAALARVVFLEVTTPESRERIDFSLGPLPPASADAGLIRQVWVNLLSNAVKYSSKREQVVIEVGGRVQGDDLVYSVRDNGAGFDMQYANKLFGVFQRLHSSRDFEGTGIGLSIVQRIVTRHGGRVWAQSEPDKGATFSFALPGRQTTRGDAGNGS